MDGKRELMEAWEAHQAADWGKAIKLYTLVLKRQPNRKAVLNLGAKLRRLNLNDEAEVHYQNKGTVRTR